MLRKVVACLAQDSQAGLSKLGSCPRAGLGDAQAQSRAEWWCAASRPHRAGRGPCRYAWSRAEEAAASRHWSRLHERSWVHLLWSGMAWAGTACRMASLANFLVFLRHGVYRCC